MNTRSPLKPRARSRKRDAKLGSGRQGTRSTATRPSSSNLAIWRAKEWNSPSLVKIRVGRRRWYRGRAIRDDWRSPVAPQASPRRVPSAIFDRQVAPHRSSTSAVHQKRHPARNGGCVRLGGSVRVPLAGSARSGPTDPEVSRRGHVHKAHLPLDCLREIWNDRAWNEVSRQAEQVDEYSMLIRGST